MSEKGDTARQLLKEGRPYKEIAKATGLLYGSISYHARCLGITKPFLRYDWKKVQEYHDQGHPRLECKAHFGFSTDAWTAAAKRGDIVVKDYRIPLEELLVENTTKNPSHLKMRVLNAGLIPVVCYACGITDKWNGKPITLWLDHKNGSGNDWRLENLRMVCPNCDSQSETFAGRNAALNAKKRNIGK